jgi:PhoD-like phosphatase, N-terminal domain
VRQSPALASRRAARDERRRLSPRRRERRPLPDGITISTRLTAPDTPATELTWVVARDPGLEQVASRGTVIARRDRDWTAVVDITGLAPSTTYYYAVSAPPPLAPRSDADSARTPAASGCGSHSSPAASNSRARSSESSPARSWSAASSPNSKRGRGRNALSEVGVLSKEDAGPDPDQWDGDPPATPPVAVEFVTPSITSENLDDLLEVPAGTRSRAIEQRCRHTCSRTGARLSQQDGK